MWGIHDDIRKGWKQMIATLESTRPDSHELAQELEKLFTPAENAIREMFYKEEHILLPNALERLQMPTGAPSATRKMNLVSLLPRAATTGQAALNRKPQKQIK